MTVQFITTPSGDELAVLPRADFEALLEEFEDRIDNEAADRVEAALARGEMETYPDVLIGKLSDGANPVRAFREHRGLTIAKLAERSALAPDRLEQIEGGAGEVTGSEYRDLAAALSIDVELLDWA